MKLEEPNGLIGVPTYHLEVGTEEGWTWKAFEHIHQLAADDRALRDEDGNRLDFNWSMEAYGLEPDPTPYEQLLYAILDTLEPKESPDGKA